MNKLAVFFVLASCIALTWAFPNEEKREAAAPRAERRNVVDCSPSAVAALRHYGVDVSQSHLCGPSSKRFASEFGRILRRRELEYEISRPRFARGEFNACCSPDCDWLLTYLEIDSTVVKCIDKK
ncbi:uncharacterized protein LOC116286834 [Actinia tenebrosa]|uniref:Uncharacterized protein LOC116286834 n=1 Tax=Actinia tenebrosa TaxID=6105 RepID=A0A6P8GYJ4_ACTTE|nr:uncharacterized protein LOC116286834 [Actinia tenebrosa]